MHLEVFKAKLPGEGATRKEISATSRRSTHTHQELRNRVTVTTATNLAGEHNARKEGRRRARRPRRLLLALLLLLVPPEVGLDGQSRLLGGIAEEFALTAGIRGHIAFISRN